MIESARSGWPKALSALKWRWELLYVAFAAMEACWLTPFLVVALRLQWQGPPYVAGMLLFSLLWAFCTLARLAESRDTVWARLIMFGALVLAILAGWRFFLHPAAPLLDRRWIQIAGSDLIVGRSSGHWIVMVVVLFLWWRGVALSRREFAFAPVAYAFRSGVLLLVVGTALLSLVNGGQVLGFVFAFFFASLLAVALARLEEAGIVQGRAGRSLDLFWLALLLAATTLLLGVGLLLSPAASPRGIEAIRAAWAPVGDRLAYGLAALMTLVLWPFEPLLRWLVDAMAEVWRSMLSPEMAQRLADLQIAPGEASPPGSNVYLDAAWNLLRLICGGAVLLALALAGAWALQQQRRRRQDEVVEEHEALDANLLDALRRRGDDLRRAMAHLGQFGLSGGLLVAISVRNIYANTAQLARQRGYPRDKALTPYEYLPDLQAAFPQAQAEAQAITDAYVAVHYGELPTSREELEALRAAYEQLKASVQ